jgi:arylsulfatase A-like enzyme
VGELVSKLNRRNFLKLAGLSSSLLLLPNLTTWALENLKKDNNGRPNIILLVFDAMSARNLSLYGYPRPTTPNLERFAEHATVYHSHYSNGNFTPAGTSSLLTGTYPWTHRAINVRGVIKRDLIGNDIFTTLGDGYTRLAFPQNFWANLILTQFEDQIEHLIPSSAFSELDFIISDFFPKDKNMAARALDDFTFKLGGQPVPLVLGSLERWMYSLKSGQLPNDGYPKNIPYMFDYPVNFRLEKVFDGLTSIFANLKTPFFTYLHLLPPHAPYIASSKFHNLFRDGLKFIKKPEHPLSEKMSNAEVLLFRRQYDEYIASTDHEFGSFLDFLESSGLFENSYVFITSDHGEMFERGEIQHSTPLLYDPVIHIPLLVSAPGQKSRRDVYTPTSAVDILPTIVKLAGKPLPPLTAGTALPGFEGGADNFDRSIYMVEAKLNPANQPFKDATIALRKGNHKLIYYTGYGQEDVFEFYELENDIEEMNDLYPQKPAEAKRMKDELLEAFYAANRPYTR